MAADNDRLGTGNSADGGTHSPGSVPRFSSSDQSPITNHRSPPLRPSPLCLNPHPRATSFQSPATSCPLLVPENPPKAETSHRSLVTNHRTYARRTPPPAALSIAHRALPTEHRALRAQVLLVTSHEPRATFHEFMALY
jgi:hypothetical protein